MVADAPSRIFPDLPANAVVAPLLPNEPIDGWEDISEPGTYLVELGGVNDPFQAPVYMPFEIIDVDGEKIITLEVRDDEQGIAVVDILGLNNITHAEVPAGSGNTLSDNESHSFSPPFQGTMAINFRVQNPFMAASGEIEVANAVGRRSRCQVEAPASPERV